MEAYLCFSTARFGDAMLLDTTLLIATCLESPIAWHLQIDINTCPVANTYS
jgi:hypothetical protein